MMPVATRMPPPQLGARATHYRVGLESDVSWLTLRSYFCAGKADSSERGLRDNPEVSVRSLRNHGGRAAARELIEAGLS
jgi:hypothetical protein